MGMGMKIDSWRFEYQAALTKKTAVLLGSIVVEQSALSFRSACEASNDYDMTQTHCVRVTQITAERKVRDESAWTILAGASADVEGVPVDNLIFSLNNEDDKLNSESNSQYLNIQIPGAQAWIALHKLEDVRRAKTQMPLQLFGNNDVVTAAKVKL